MDIDLLEDFITLADELNFSAAATRRNVTQPAFSRRIKMLEQWLGAPLLRRTSRSVALTNAGRIFYLRASVIIRDIKRAREETREAAGKAERNLSIASTHALSFTFVPRWMLQTIGHSSISSASLITDSYAECEALLLSGDAVFLICHRRPETKNKLTTRQFMSQTISQDVLVPLSAPGENGEPRWSLDQATADRPIPQLSYASASGLGRILEEYWSENRSRPALQTQFSSDLAATLLEMVKEGQGVAWVPLSLAERDIKAGQLARAGGHEFDIPVDITLIRPTTRLSLHAEQFWQKAVNAHSKV
ncbi:LysR family transcriptional regulator [Brucella sp. NBRC 12950]|jgi:DNA-binding transcriptional LysR family regulator|uniref:LysR family transcriptional regulator n=1 Tax=Brucella sp. NBRC 12950 TaxID=2994518 RepID=UPI0024A0050E|nr:LysR family transcriptional regulator [Brucella sp. NBRC 12950]GLU28978.1 LysR family transcriptional regulator [Brucella sp. NBRC 12950]